MTRVEDERAQLRYDEQKRIEKDLRAKNSQSADDFKKVVAAKQDSGARIQRRQQPNGSMAKQQQSSHKRGQAQRALLAKSGFQSRDLQTELMKRSDKIIAQHQAEHKDRDIDLHQKTEVEHDKQLTTQRDEGKKNQVQADRLAAIAGEEKRKGSEDDGSETGGGMGGGQMGMPMGHSSQGAAPAAEAKGNAGGARIPQNALNAIVKLCAVKINPKGLAEFQIELRDDVLGGSKLNISANGRKINATFVSDDANVRRLLKSSEGDLARAFDNSGLTLESFKVSAF